MTERTEWEVVDAPSADPRQAKLNFVKALLGPWWRWKFAAAITIAGVALIFFAALAGVTLMILAAGTFITIATAKVRQWLHRGNRSLVP